MLKSFNEWLDRHFKNMTQQAINPVVTYAIPGAPPTGRHVATAAGAVFVRTHVADPEHGQWGTWLELTVTPLNHLSWPELLTLGPLVLLPLNTKELADAILYGPPGARWGDPDEPCPWGQHSARKPTLDMLGKECALGIGHTGPHCDPAGNPYNQTEETDHRWHYAAVTREDLDTPCNCGRPAAHRPHCNRFARVAGTETK